jgi:hypothetical protein
LTTRSLDRLPVALRPYPDETLSSWLSRTASVYGCTAQELLNSYHPFRQEPIDVIDLQPSDATLTSLHVLLGTHPAQLDACTLAGVYPTWIPDWLSRPSPLWNVSERRTVAVAGLSPAVCSFCLREDIRKGQSQYSRLGWYCAISTICPIHRAPLFSCCPTNLYHERLPVQSGAPTARSYCLDCHANLDRLSLWDFRADEEARRAVAQFESLLRSALSERRLPGFANQDLESAHLLSLVQDLTWGLMRPVAGTTKRALHFMHTPQFIPPVGFNTPVEAENWLSCGSLVLRRCILAIVASLFLPAAACGALVPECGRGTPFWTTMRSLHNADDRKTLSDKATLWNPQLREAVDFYW